MERFRVHEAADCHKEARLKLSSAAAPTVYEQMSIENAKAMALNREMFLKVLSSLMFLMRQGLAIRGHKDDDSDGNLLQLLKLRCEEDSRLSKWLGRRQYLSHDIINELITIFGNELLRQLLNTIRTARWFAILADETADITNCEQLSISIRWVNENFAIHEDFIGLVHVPRITASVLTEAIKDILIRCSLPLAQCRGQAYDGAASMMGHIRGVATRLQAEENSAIAVHCFAHCLNLCLQDAVKQCKPIRSALDVVLEICKLIKRSPKRSLIFEQCKQALSLPGTGLRPLCPTRWTVRCIAIDAVLRNYSALLEK